jgi:hypothetical protein
LLRKRITDKDILKLIEAFLKGGVTKGRVFNRTEIGTQRGGIISPLLAMVILHQFDLWWWEMYGCLIPNERRQRRRRSLGHPILIRYADDWLLLWDGSKDGAVELGEEAKQFLERGLKLELSESKTRITHVDEGLTFLGFDIQRFQGAHGKPVALIRPSEKNARRLKSNIRVLARRNTTCQPAWCRILQLSQIPRGWSVSYQHIDAKPTFSKLDWRVMNRVFLWASKKYGKPPWQIIRAKYPHRDPKRRINSPCDPDDGSLTWLYCMSDRPMRRYSVNWQRSSYADASISTDIEDETECLVGPVSYTAKEKKQVCLVVRRRDNHTCQPCGKWGTSVRIHHARPREHGPTDELDSLITPGT